MAIFEWDDEFSINIFMIDSHHKKLFDIMNKLYEVMAEGAKDADILSIIIELLNYTNYHFSEEEKMMAQFSYPELSEHKELHRKFVAELVNAKTKAENGLGIFVATTVADLGVNWLKAHILTVDRRYKDYMDRNNIVY